MGARCAQRDGIGVVDAYMNSTRGGGDKDSNPPSLNKLQKGSVQMATDGRWTKMQKGLEHRATACKLDLGQMRKRMLTVRARAAARRVAVGRIVVKEMTPIVMN